VTDVVGAFGRVISSPTLDQPRLDFADAVEGQDPDWARYIRLEVNAAERRRQWVETDLDGYAEASVLHDRNANRWARDIDQYVSGRAFLRGFVEHVWVDAEWFTETAEELYLKAPILHLDVTDVGICADDFFGSPHLRRIVSLAVPRNELTDDDVALLAASPHLGNLEYLDLSGNRITQAGLEILAASENLPKLGYLAFDGNRVADPTPRFADEYDYTSAEAERLQEAFGPREWLDAHPRWVWPPARDAVYWER
jgi:hypothetical protein